MGCSSSADGANGKGSLLLKQEKENQVLLDALVRQSVLDLVGGVSVRKSSAGSVTDKDLHKVEAFAEKSVVTDGNDVFPGNITFTCRKGKKDAYPNQDSWCVVDVVDRFTLCGIFDGHGHHGHDVSDFVKDTLPKLIIRDQRFRTKSNTTVFKDAFKKMQELIALRNKKRDLDADASGTTVTVVLHDRENKRITVAHVGDSSVCLGSNKHGVFNAYGLTQDHKPNVREEKIRIHQNGGRVVYDGICQYRVFAKSSDHDPGLNMSRCLGDLFGHAEAGLSGEPDVREHTLDPEDKYVLLCSDGVWEFMRPKEAFDILRSTPSLMKGTHVLAQRAWDKWMKEAQGSTADDITAIVIAI